jgi:hypothetical protein
MSNEFNFGPAMQDFGRGVLRDLVKTDYGPGATSAGCSGVFVSENAVRPWTPRDYVRDVLWRTTLVRNTKSAGR